ncbi:hypothetical protein M9Y10_004449 [Tritrichomonas musculus]|uniref:Mon2/Sec7/BIG1-like HUS domain-containing protein n=1 Tax=Tritrichomonas musculus TaxID=1915356 RepID=A0ABR2JRZ0_9EUKA
MDYKYVSIYEYSNNTSYVENEFEILFSKYTTAKGSSINMKENIKFLNLKIIYRHIAEAYKTGNSNKMHDILCILIQYLQFNTILYSIEFNKYNILSIFYSCLISSSPPYLTIKTIELITLILKQKNKTLGESFISQKLTQYFFDLTIHHIRYLKNDKSNTPEQNANSFIILIRILICIDQVANFSSDGNEYILNYFFRNPLYIIQEILHLTITDAQFDQILEISKFYCCKLICTISQAKISRNDSGNLFKLICTNWKCLFKDPENLIKTDIIEISLRSLVLAVYNLMTIIPDSWAYFFVEYCAWFMVEQCLVIDKAEIAIPAVNCVIQLLAQGVDIKVNYSYFVQLLLAHQLLQNSDPIEKVQIIDFANSNQQKVEPIEKIQKIDVQESESISKTSDLNQQQEASIEKVQTENQNSYLSYLSNQAQSPDFKISSTLSRKENSIELVCLSCFAIERMVIINHLFGQEFVKCGIFDAIKRAIQQYQFHIQFQCINCVCAIIHSQLTSGYDLLLQANIIELLVEFTQVNIDDVTLLRIINILEEIFQMSITNGLQEETIQRFIDADGDDAMLNNSNKGNEDIDLHISRLFNTYKSLQNKDN